MDLSNGLRTEALRCVSLALSGIALVLAFAAVAVAQQATATPDVYKITFSVEFSQDSGTTYTEVVSGRETNIGAEAVAAGGTATTITVTGVSGNFNRARATLNCTTKLKGGVTFGGVTYFTTSGGGVSTTGPAAEGSYDLPGAFCTPPSVTVQSPVFDPPFTIGGTLVLTFDAAGALQLSGAPGAPVLSPGPFSANMTTE